MSRVDPLAAEMAADIAVIGSGPGGAVTAALCAETGRSVLLLEEGANLSINSAPHFSNTEILQKYRNGGVNIAFGRTKIAYVEGRCVGGGSEVNRGLYHRIPDYILEQWRAEFGVQDLLSDDLMPHFMACEKTAHVEYLPDQASLLSTRLQEGANSLGWNAIEAPRLYRYGAPGRKQSMSETFIPRFLDAGGHLIADTRVSRLTRSGGRWRISARHAPKSSPPRHIDISADIVFVACGAVQTPALLRRSGFARNIGNSLRFHPMLKVVALFDEDVQKPGDQDPVHQIKEFEPRFGMGCSISTRPMLALAMAAHPDHLEQVDRNWRRMAIYYVQNKSGYAKVRNLPGFRDPLVTISQGAAERSQLAEGLKRLAEALFAAGAKVVYPCILGYPALYSLADVHALPATLDRSDSSATSVHVFSSCPMGENKGLCATDSFGRVHGADRLYIADASLLCGPTVVNPQGTVMAVAHRNACKAIEDGFR
ncbi:GMC family oxidoreductase N-terminal domain-containing protein [Rhizorhapis sp. SPR117]|uniref:GMC family oxidoreductase N-terminal domain-containing protein n=1 Tax=Rhizorhapis sp. SPR117 TaxID=2912611 RepID=UPI001F2016FD|nr:GMC family oxidoreductase [Rhizorhapis sp. SPR117]